MALVNGGGAGGGGGGGGYLHYAGMKKFFLKKKIFFSETAGPTCHLESNVSSLHLLPRLGLIDMPEFLKVPV